MGACMIVSADFGSIKDKQKFDKMFGLTIDELVTSHNSKYDKKSKTAKHDPSVYKDIIYFSHYGYAEHEEIVSKAIKAGIKIKFYAYFNICDRHQDEKWVKLRGRWE